MLSRPIAGLVLLLAAFGSLFSSVARDPPPNATVELAPRQSEISAVDCTLQGKLVQCCQTSEPLEDVASVVDPILEGLGIPLPGLGTLVAFDCQDTVLGLGCSESSLCCTLVVPEQDIGVDCVPVEPVL